MRQEWTQIVKAKLYRSKIDGKLATITVSVAKDYQEKAVEILGPIAKILQAVIE